MAKMGVAAAATHFGAFHKPARVRVLRDIVLLDRLPEAGPARAGIEFGAGIKERLAATNTLIDAGFFGIPVDAGKGLLRPLAAGNAKLFRAENLFPLLIRFLDFLDHCGIPP